MGLLLLADFFDEWLGWTVAGLLPEVRTHFRLDYSGAGWVLGAHFLGGYVGSAVGGVLADLGSRRRLLLGGAALSALGFALAATAPNVPLLLFGCLCVGLASGPVVHTAQLILADRARRDGQRLERFLARFNAMGSAGDVLGPLVLAAALGLGVGWRVLFAGASAAIALYGLALLVLPRGVSEAPHADSGRLDWHSLKATIGDRRLLRLALALALLDGLDEPFAGFAMIFLRDVAGASAASANLILGVLVGSSLIGFVLVGHAPWSRSGMIRAFLVVLGLALSGFVLLPVLPLRILCLALVGLGSAGFYTVALAEALSIRPKTTGTTMALLSVVGVLSLALPPLAGALADAFGLTASMLVYVALPPLMLGLAGQPAGHADQGAAPPEDPSNQT